MGRAFSRTAVIAEGCGYGKRVDVAKYSVRIALLMYMYVRLHNYMYKRRLRLQRHSDPVAVAWVVREVVAVATGSFARLRLRGP